MKTIFTLIFVAASYLSMAQSTDSLTLKTDSLSVAIEKQKQALEALKSEKEKRDKEAQEKVKAEQEKIEKDSLQKLEEEVAKLEKEKQDLEKLKLEKEKYERERVEKLKLEKEELEKEKERKRQEMLSQKSISFDRTALQADINKIEKPVFNPGNIEVIKSAVKTADGNKEALELVIPEVSIDKVRKDWYRTLKKSTKSDVTEKGNSYAAYGSNIKKISNEPIDIEVNFIDKQGAVHVSAILQKDSAVVNPNNYPQIYASAEGYLKRYGLETYKDKVKADIKGEEKTLKDMKKELDKLIKKNEKEHKKISDNRILIDAAEDELKLNDNEREQALVNIQNKRNRVRQVSGKDAVKAAKKDVKTAQKEKKSLEKQRKKTYRGIVSYKSDIERTNQAIDLNLQRQKEQTLVIYKQELKVKALEDKLAMIK